MTSAPMQRGAWWTLVGVLSIVIVAAVSLGAWQFVMRSRHVPLAADQAANRQVVLDAAKANVTKVFSYTSDTIEQDMKAAEAVLTGDFLDQYKQYARDAVIPSTRDMHVTATASVVAAAVESLTRDKASILVFFNQTTTTRDQPAPTVGARSVRVGMLDVNGVWLIESLQPI